MNKKFMTIPENGHQAILRMQSIKWELFECIGKAFAEQLKDHTSDILEKEARKILNSSIQSSEESTYILFEKISKIYKQHGFDPKDNHLIVESDHNPWIHIMKFRLAIELSKAYIDWRPLSKSSQQKAMIEGRNDSRSLFYHFQAWSFGSQTFYITYPLAAKLLLTDVHRITWEDVKFPFPSFIIQLPENPIFFLKDPEEDQPIDTIIVCNLTENNIGTLQFMAKGVSKNRHGIGGDTYLFFGLRIDNLQQNIQESIENSQIDSFFKDNPQTYIHYKDSNKNEIRPMLNFIMSIILYISSHPEERRKKDPQIKEIQNKLGALKGKKKEKAKKKFHELKKQHENSPHIIGSHITIDPNLDKIAKAAATKSGIRHYAASYVRGHHKMQAHGPLKTLRKMIWIEPYWRNLDSKISTQKTYTVK